MTEAAIPPVFLPYQQRLWQAIDTHNVTVIEKSRRTGYSWAVAAVAAEYAGRRKSARGCDVLYVGYEKEMTREFIDYVADWGKAFQSGAGPAQEFVFRDPLKPEGDIGAFRIKFASGFEVIALPSIARALRGKQGLVILDEAAFMDDLKGLLKAAFALLIWGGKVVVISTHNGETNPFNELVTDIRAGRASYHLDRLTFDEAVAEGLYRRICFVKREAWTAEGEAKWRQGILDDYRDNADEELHVIPNPVSGVYLPGALIEARMVDGVKVVRWSCPAGFAQLPEATRIAAAEAFCRRELLPILEALDAKEAHCLGEDFGRIRDLTVLWLLALCRDMVRRTRLVIELRNVPFEQQKQILFFVLDRVPRFRAAKMDGTGNGAFLAEVAVQRYGARVEAVMLNEPWYRENMPPLKAAIEDAMLTLPRDKDIYHYLRMLKLVRGVARIPDRARGNEGASRHGDAAIAACMAYAASRAEPEEYGYEAASPVRVLIGPPVRSFHDRADDDEDDMPRLGAHVLRGAL